MASTFRSHLRLPPQPEESTAQSRKKSNSRAPTKPSGNDGKVRTSKSAPHVSQLTKRSSKSVAAADKTEHDAQDTRRASNSATAMPNHVAQPKRMSVTPSGFAASSQSSSNSRSNTPFRPPTVMPTPSLVSGSSASLYDPPRSAFLRRKPSTIERHVASRRAETPATEPEEARMYGQHDDFDGEFKNTVLGISFPTTSYLAEQERSISQHGYAPDQPMRNFITPPVNGYAPSATPSTRYTDSPFSHVPTPSSASSYSSSVYAPAANKTPPTRSRPPAATKTAETKDSSRLGLPPVRESSTSSSNSTVKPSRSKPSVPTKDVPQKSATAPPAGEQKDQHRPTSRGKLVKERPRKLSADGKSKAKPQIPPELAHLNVEPPPKTALNKALPPLRPSRDGTPNLQGLSNPSSVVQSDLPKLYTTYHKRTPSQETPTSPSLKSRFGFSSKSSSRQPSPRIDSAVSPPPAARVFARGPTPDSAPANTTRLPRKDSPAVDASPSKSPRFGFFTRKPKEMTKPLEKPKRQVTKGPAAGTGHEGYGRFGFRGRSGSTASSTGVRSPSTDSNGSSQPIRKSTSRQSSVGSKEGSELDDFLKERLNPVYLRGSGSTFSATASSSDGHTESAMPSSNTSSIDSYPKPQLLPSAMNVMAGISPSKQRQASDSSEDDVRSHYPTFAARQSMIGLPQQGVRSTAQIPSHLDTKSSTRNDSIDSCATEGSADLPSQGAMVQKASMEGKEGLWLREKLDEPSKPTWKWNFFQRAQASPKGKGKEKQPQPTLRQAPQRGLTHQTMLGPVEQVGMDEVERIAQENFTSPDDSMSESNVPTRFSPYDNRQSNLLPSPPKLEYGSRDADFKARPLPPRITIRQDSTESAEVLQVRTGVPNVSPTIVDVQRSPVIPEPEDEEEEVDHGTQSGQHLPPTAYHTPEMPQAPFNTPEKGVSNESPRQPRLSPVGRIPKVVSRRDRDRKLSDSSFSRPFVRTQPRPTVKPPGSLYSQIRELASPVEPSSGSQPVSSTSTNSNGGSGDFKSSVNTSAPSASTARTSMDMHANPEFFAFPPRKDSDVSYSTSSGHNSYLAPMWPQPLHEDEIWTEYNDLMDEVLNPNTPLSASSSLGAPFQYSNALHDPLPAAVPFPLNWSQPPTMQLPSIPRAETTSAVLSVPQQISRFMQPSMSPLTPHTLADFYDQYGNPSMSNLSTANRSSTPSQYRSSVAAYERNSVSSQNRSSLPQPTNNRSSLPGTRGSMASSRYSRSSAHSRSASLPEANVRNSQSSLTQSSRFNRDTQLLDIAEVDGDEQAAAANLRFGALMTSKWLSNGRVLFSPAHNEMRLADEPRVLIIDGLGSDWSFYVALSYPSATVYNLGPEASASWPGVNQMPPSNHRHITHPAISTGFPFPKGFFTAVVFRFPVATNDQAYQACIFECKRVLRPGGHLEVTVLDLDLNCMGNRARKAIRGLKTRMQHRDADVSLRNTSDFLLRVIGRRGFEEVQRCVVGVPAAGRIPRSQDISSRSSRDSGKHIWQRESHLALEEFSFADLLEDARANRMESDNATRRNDEGITKTVAKVGRWWYSACYEQKALLPHGDHSIWSDAALLRECEKQGTSFRLLICHAQKPAQTRRRTVSV